MKGMKSLTLLLAAGLLALSPAGAAFPADSDAVKPFAVGRYTVLPLLDSQGQMKMELFSGPLSQEEKAALMPGGSAPSSVNMFLIQGPAGNILIDAGRGEGDILTERLKAAGLAVGDINLVLLTHTHGDHIGGLLKGPAPVFPKARVLLSAPEREAADLSALQAAYGDRLGTFELGATVAEGLTSVPIVGHTPGHTGFLLESEGKKLLFVGDVLHAALLQFPHPEENASYDRDKEQAAASRRAILTKAADEGLPIAGAHIPFPGAGLVKKEGQGFSFTPVESF